MIIQDIPEVLPNLYLVQTNPKYNFLVMGFPIDVKIISDQLYVIASNPEWIEGSK
jgi:hypothetical protein